MLALTRKTDYALVALVHLARNPSALASAREISSRYGIPLSVLMNIMKSLTKSEFVESVRGVRGGYRLLVDPATLTLKGLIHALEGPVRLLPCVDADENGRSDCDLSCGCPVRNPATRVHRRFDEFLDNVTLSELAEDVCQLESSPAPALVEIHR